MLKKISKLLLISFFISLGSINKSFAAFDSAEWRIYRGQMENIMDGPVGSSLLGFGIAVLGNKVYQYKNKNMPTLAGAIVLFLAAGYHNIWRKAQDDTARLCFYSGGAALGQLLAYK